jgi:hypothetical protein
MGEGTAWGFIGKTTIAALLLVFGGVHRYVYHSGEGAAKSASSPEIVSVDDDTAGEDFALFTHEKNELHCMERELRHPCVRELRDWVSDQKNAEARQEALRCVNGVLQATNEYWELKNMTHLLLDLDTVDHVFDKGNRSSDFVMAGLGFAEKLMKHEECMEEFDSKNEFETRCVPLYGKIAILKYKNAGMIEKAKETFRRLTSMSFTGKVNTYAAGEAVRWDHWQHTPQIWVNGLRSQPIWPREMWGDLPICKQLEDNFETLREEAQKAVQDPTDNGFEDAYRFLYEKGEWNHIMLYHDRKFSEECETVFPKMCALLKQWLPSKPGLPWLSNQGEQAMVIKMKEGTDVETHSGPANNILNIHIGISGLEGARLTIANETYSWQEGKVIAWDGSYDHAVDCVHCTQERVIMMVRYMHPDMNAAHFKGIKRTHYEEVPLELQ